MVHHINVGMFFQLNLLPSNTLIARMGEESINTKSIFFQECILTNFEFKERDTTLTIYSFKLKEVSNGIGQLYI